MIILRPRIVQPLSQRRNFWPHTDVVEGTKVNLQAEPSRCRAVNVYYIVYKMMRMLIAFFTFVWLLPVGIPYAASANESLDQAIRLFSAKQYQESQPLFEQVVAAQPDNAKAHFYLGRIYLKSGDFDKAIAHCKTSVNIHANVAEYHFCLGRSYGEKARRAPFWRQAFLAPKIRKAFEATVALDPTHRSARIGLTHFYMRAPLIMGGSLAKAQEQAEKLIELKDPKGKQLLQDILKRQNKALMAN